MSFAISKILRPLLEPGNLLLLVLVAAAVLGLAGGRRARRWSVGLTTAAAAGLLVLTFLPVGEWALGSLENRFPRPDLPERVDGVIVLGGMVDQVLADARGEPTLLDSAERLMAFIELGRRYPEAELVFTGGSGQLSEQRLKEGPTVRAVLAQIGFDAGRIRFESESRNTYENAVLSKALVGPEPGETWILVTSAFHMPRSVGIFEAQGWPVIPYPVDFRTLPHPRLNRVDAAAALDLLGDAAKEWAGLIAYRLMGRTSALFPGP